MKIESDEFAGDFWEAVMVDSYISDLRRRLGFRPPTDRIRAQTREGVRRFRARRAGASAAS